MDVLLMLLVSVLYILSPVHPDNCEYNCQNGGIPSRICGKCLCFNHTGDHCELDDLWNNLVVDSTDIFLGLPFNMMCEVTNARGFGIIASKVEFFKVVDIGAEEPVYMLQNGSKCSEHNNIPGYKAKCGKGTDDVDSDVKLYTLQIARVKEDDATDWSCKINYPRIAIPPSKRLRIAA
ncbi:uncharacterized protein LOC121373300 [Gigantopelta aegis]|uniref:uncharacterized protein LOC121373300 n=1 Tax=Gigantopelta aegis TaxID=1735272 RepID=UPI001B88A20D|nr:uncharacterized protein LOC121373300 [Gigantopelta aegis]